MTVLLNKESLTEQVEDLNLKPKPETVLKDYLIDGTLVKKVPFTLDRRTDPPSYFLDGHTLQHVYDLIDANQASTSKTYIINYTEEHLF